MGPKLQKIVLFILLLLTNMAMFAQEIAQAPPPPQRTIDPPPGLVVPIDENVWVLFAAGLFFGGYVAYKKWRAKQA